MLEYQDRLTLAMEVRGIKTADLARALGVSYQAVDRVVKGKSNSFTASNNAAAAGCLRVNPDWLATGKGSMEPTAAPPGLPIAESSLRPIWVVGKGAGGFMAERIWGDGDHPTGSTDQFSMLGSSDPNAFLAEVIGSSMYPKYENKNFALIEPNTEIDIEDTVLVRLLDGQTLLKRLISRRNGITLGSYNEPELLVFSPAEITWMYYSAHEVPRKKIKQRF